MSCLGVVTGTGDVSYLIGVVSIDVLRDAYLTAFSCGYDQQLLQRFTLQWRHNGCNGISNHQPHDCLLNRLFGLRSKKTSKLRVTGLCEGNSPVTGEFPAQRASNAENVSIWWRHHGMINLFIATQAMGTSIDWKPTSVLRNKKLLVPRWHCWFISIIDFSRKPLFLYFVSKLVFIHKFNPIRVGISAFFSNSKIIQGDFMG